MFKKKIRIKKNFRAFTLVELLIVIAILAILASIVMVALNPLARFQDSRNAKRWSDVNLILSAVKLSQIDNGGIYPDPINNLTNGLYYQIGSGSDCDDTCSNPTLILQGECLELDDLVDGGYMSAVPVDPGDSSASEDKTRYYLVKLSNGSVTVGSCSEEQGSNSSAPYIYVSR